MRGKTNWEYFGDKQTAMSSCARENWEKKAHTKRAKTMHETLKKKLSVKLYIVDMRSAVGNVTWCQKRVRQFFVVVEVLGECVSYEGQCMFLHCVFWWRKKGRKRHFCLPQWPTCVLITEASTKLSFSNLSSLFLLFLFISVFSCVFLFYYNLHFHHQCER